MIRTLVRAAIVLGIVTVGLAVAAGGKFWDVKLKKGADQIRQTVASVFPDTDVEEIEAILEDIDEKDAKGKEALRMLDGKLRELETHDQQEATGCATIREALRDFQRLLAEAPPDPTALVAVSPGRTFPRAEVLQEIDTLLEQYERLTDNARGRAKQREILEATQAHLSAALVELGKRKELLKTRLVNVENQRVLVELLREMRTIQEDTKADGLVAQAEALIAKLEQEAEQLKARVLAGTNDMERPILRAWKEGKNPPPSRENRIADVLASDGH